MATKFEKLIEYVIANDEKKARELFHQIVVDKSRKIYEALDVDDTERAFDDVEADHTATDEIGGDEADGLESDVFVDDAEAALPMGEEEAGELNPDIDDRVADLESEFDALKAEFEELLGAEEGEIEGEEAGEAEEEAGLDDVEAAEDEAESEEEHIEAEAEEGEGEEASEEASEEHEEPVDESVIREYVLKVTQGLSDDKEEGFVNKKSVTKPQASLVSGVSAKNLNQSAEEKGRPEPKSSELIGDKEVVNRPGRKSVELKSTPKPVTSKEESGVNKKSIES